MLSHRRLIYCSRRSDIPHPFQHSHASPHLPAEQARTKTFHNKIIEEKVLLLRHVVNLESATLAAEVLAAQRQLELSDTLWSEGIQYLRELEISVYDINLKPN